MVKAFLIPGDVTFREKQLIGRSFEDFFFYEQRNPYICGTFLEFKVIPYWLFLLQYWNCLDFFGTDLNTSKVDIIFSCTWIEVITFSLDIRTLAGHFPALWILVKQSLCGICMERPAGAFVFLFHKINFA